MTSALSDNDLITAVLAGENSSYEELVRRYQGIVLHYFRLHHLYEEALDLTQETFLQAWRSLYTYKVRWRFSTWILAIAHQKNALYFRSKARKIQPQVGVYDELLDCVKVSDTSECVQAEERENLWKYIRENLSPEQSEALWLFYVEEKSLEEIALILARSVGSVKSILFRAKQALQKKLDKQDYE